MVYDTIVSIVTIVTICNYKVFMRFINQVITGGAHFVALSCFIYVLTIPMMLGAERITSSELGQIFTNLAVIHGKSP